ncbi:hypothetical protein FDH34_gp506 [Serratia phage BF]|uniref:Uncharacterized protein n=2 Tax=Eneladusvirus BF TaxID=2560751 RepID=A0A7L8ZN28_9CAUD|nr:hypothetical protein FDH34_gp506 [Serratia phage BF]AQW88939.1 hypothetical protein BF_0414 [Serratia phage BF]QOI71895.1 hypothetical protein pEaSNUABM47_00417 [Erwinia phage pEa_SNUABM_47]QXO12109.1 hypothetical protein pEaSNUABM44_00419 [Erwinia phage pEa_SNUABM_44]QXO12662.1 hypothetical protein pEaSNUABM49_00422 [Erwinia phage pEa_SNUABM_49]
MKMLNLPSTVKCNVNGCELEVPRGIHYIVINYTGHIDAYETKPYLREGMWVNDGEVGIYLGHAKLEDNDEWTHPFLVDKNRFSTYSDCD